MRKSLALFFIISISLSSCTVKETIVIEDDGSGTFLASYDLSSFMKIMEDTFSEATESKTEKKAAGEVMDTTVVFRDLMKTHKDSIAALPEEKQLALEAVKDMYMKMSMNEDQGKFDFGVGIDFKTIDELEGIKEKIEKARSLSAQSDQVGAMKTGSPLGKFMDDGKSEIAFSYNDTSFSRVTAIENTKNEIINFEEPKEQDKEFVNYFKNAYYIIEYTFPKAIKSTSIPHAQLSNDNKTITYKANWLDYIKEPKSLDINIEFINE